MNLIEQLERLNALFAANAITAEEFAKAKAKLLSDDPVALATPKVANGANTTNAMNRLGRSANDRWFGGVCGGLAASTDMPAWAWRVLFVLLALLHGLGILLYVLLWIFMPLTVAAPARLQTPAPTPVPTSPPSESPPQS